MSSQAPISRRGRYVGVGTDRYASHPELDHPVAEVREVGELLGRKFAGEPVCDKPRVEVLEVLERLPDDSPEVLMLVWAGHGQATGGRLELITSDSKPITASDVVAKCVGSGAGQLLFVFDVCHAGAGLPEVSTVASALQAEYPPDADRVWFGVVVSCRAGERARDGAFGALLRRLLKDGPRSADSQRRWSRHNELIYGDDLGAALMEEWEDEEQRPNFFGWGRRWFILPNPLWDPDAPEQVVEHLLAAARGSVDARRSWFTGRVGEVDTVVGWVTERAPGIRVVTGLAGTGKSAILGRVVSLSNPTERERLERQGGWEHADPGVRSVRAHLHARGLTADQAAEVLDAQLCRSVDDNHGGRQPVLPKLENPRNAAELVGALQRLHQNGTPPPVIAVDGLDEAGGEAFGIAENLLARIAAFATVVVSTRRRDRDHKGVPQALLDVLAPVAVLDLDTPAQRQSAADAIRRYAAGRLASASERSERMDPAMVAEALADRADAREAFLLARIVVDQLVAEPIDTAAPNWRRHLADSIGAAFDADLARVTAGRRTPLDGVAPVDLARLMLTALTWGLGAGFPEDEWLAVSSALVGAPLDAGHITWVLDQLGRYVMQGGEDGVAAYRIAHQALADHLRPRHTATADQPFDPDAAPVWSALADRYRQLLADGLGADEPGYLWRHAYRHAADAGPDGVGTLRGLVEVQQRLKSSLAWADLQIANTQFTWGRHQHSVSSAEEAVSLLRELAATSPDHRPGLANALNNLGNCHRGLGQPREALDATLQAVALLRELEANDPARRPDLARALGNLCLRYSELGQFRGAILLVQEAVSRYRDLAATNPAYQADLARVLISLGAGYHYLDLHSEALAPAEEAVTLLRALAAANPAHQPQLAGALINLGVFYSDSGRPNDALPLTEQAVALLKELAADNPAHQGDLAAALTSLGNRYLGVGQPLDALPPTEDGVELLRKLAPVNHAHLPALAAGLVSLGAVYLTLGQPREALPPAEQAVTLLTVLAATNPAHRRGLAAAVSNLFDCYGELGRLHAALPPTKQGVAAYRSLAGANPALPPETTSPPALPGPGQRALQLVNRAAAATPRDLRAVGWLVEAIDAVAGDHAVVGAAHEVARAHRRADPTGWERAWTDATGQPAPAWLSVDAGLLATARKWLDTRPFAAQRDHLLAHPELLDPASEPAIAEALLLGTADPAVAEPYRTLLAEARDAGVETAYRPRIVGELISRFLDATHAEQLELLKGHPSELAGPDALDRLVGFATSENPSDDLMRGSLLLVIAAHPDSAALVPQLFAALEDARLFPPLMRTLAADPAAAATLLGPTAVIAATVADTPEALAVAQLFGAAAAATAGAAEDATRIVRRAIGGTPGQRLAWIASLTELGDTNPAVLDLIAHLRPIESGTP